MSLVKYADARMPVEAVLWHHDDFRQQVGLPPAHPLRCEASPSLGDTACPACGLLAKDQWRAQRPPASYLQAKPHFLLKFLDSK